MANEEYKEIFLGEAREHVDNINNSLVELEKNPKDSELINTTFRSFHTLKGNGATMGYEKFSTLAHKLEDLLDLIRDKKLKINSDIMDILFIGCDKLNEGLQLITNDNSESLDYSEVMGKLQQVNPSEQIQEATDTITDKIELSKTEKESIKKLKIDESTIKRLIVEFDETPLKSIKSLTIIKKLSNENIIRTNPVQKDIPTIPFDKLEIILSSNNFDVVEGVIKQITKIKSYKILNLDESYKSHEKEDSKAAIVQQHIDEHNNIQEVKIDIKRLDALMDMVGELLIYNMRLENINSEIKSKQLEELMSSISLLTQNIQNEVIEERMIPLKSVFGRFPRVVRDLSREENKQIDFQVEGEENKLDRTVIDKLTDPLMHIIRNSIDHGIETPQERLLKGKSEIGVLRLVARREKNHVVIEVIDDGAGIDPLKIKESAIRKKIIPREELDTYDDDKLKNLIFMPGFSTNETITEVSGRGVGMDVVKTNIKEAKGKVYLESELNVGTKIRMELPLTMAIITVLIVEVGNEKYSIPLNNVFKALVVKQNDLKRIENQETFILNNETIPLLRLKQLVGLEPEAKVEETVLIVETNHQKLGIVIDKILEQQQILIKNIDETIKKAKGISGATILGDGNVCFIIDIETLIGK